MGWNHQLGAALVEYLEPVCPLFLGFEPSKRGLIKLFGWYSWGSIWLNRYTVERLAILEEAIYDECYVLPAFCSKKQFHLQWTEWVYGFH